MADTFTANLVLTKPEIGASTDTWGTKLNANSDAIASLFSTGPALKVANGGTGATTASAARTSLGLSTMATQSASAVAITGGTATLSTVDLSAADAYLTFYESDAATDNRRWNIRANGQQLTIGAMNDAWSSSSNAFTVSRLGASISAVNIAATAVTINGSTAYHAGNISGATILESQVADGATFPRLASSETITGTWNFTSVPQKTSGGKFIHYASSTYNSGAVTVSTSDPTGTPGEGDRWVKYTA